MTIHKDILALQAKLRTALINGHYKYISRDKHTAKVEVSGIPFELWLPVCDPSQNFRVWTYSDSIIFDDVLASDEDRLAAYGTILRVIEENTI